MVCEDPRKTLGIAQINIAGGLLSFAAVCENHDSVYVNSLVVYWGSFCLIVNGFLSVATVGSRYSCVMNSALCMNVISIVAAAIGAIVAFVDAKRMHEGIMLCNNDQCQSVEYMIFHHGLKVILVTYVIEILQTMRIFGLIWKAKG